MTITVIIPTYRRAHYLRYAIKSIVSQKYSDFELYIYDNASGDGTELVVQEFMKKDSRIHYYCHQENIGMIKNYVFGISQVKTPFFCFLSDDDILLPSFFETALKGFEAHPDIAFSATSTILISSEQKQIVTIPLEEWEKEGYFQYGEGVSYMIGRFPVPTSILFSQKVISLIEIDQENPLYWDCDFLMHIAAQFPFFISKDICALFRCHRNSYSNSREFEESRNGLCRLIQRIKIITSLELNEVKAAEQLLTKLLIESSRHFFLQYFKNRRYSEQIAIGNYLKDLSAHNRKSGFLFYMVKVFQKFPYFLFALNVLALNFGKIFQKRNSSPHKYNDYIKLLLSPE